jgi:DNA-binding NarL/FixJ family response regulator
MVRGFFFAFTWITSAVVLDLAEIAAYDGAAMHSENDRGVSHRSVPPLPNPTSPLRALCIARHCILSEHIARYFAAMGLLTTNVVGLESALNGTADSTPDVVICDYDLLSMVPLEEWERDRLLSRTPVVAVSLTRHEEELQLLDVNGIAGFLYLPTLDQSAALRILYAAAARPKYSLPSASIHAPETTARTPGTAATRPVEHS